jgi:hypothetical protein
MILSDLMAKVLVEKRFFCNAACWHFTPKSFPAYSYQVDQSKFYCFLKTSDKK